MATDLTVAKTILEQLGGRKFIVMTGIKKFLGSEDSLQFRLRGLTKNKARICKITLTWKDLYNVEFYGFNFRTGESDLVESALDIFAEDLQAVFTRHTGLYTHL